MSLRLSVDHLQQIRAHAERTYPDECCGLLLGKSGTGEKLVEAVQAMQNAWNAQVASALNDSTTPNQSRRYWIAPEAMLDTMRQARQRDLDIIGIYHSHPDHVACPSEYDRQFAWSHYSYLIVSVVQGTAIDQQSWTLDEQQHFQSEPIQLAAAPRM